MDTSEMPGLAAYYDDFARNWALPSSPLYAEWAAGVAADPDLLTAIGTLPPVKRQANLVFACARWLGCPLTGFAAFRAWMLGDEQTPPHIDEVLALARIRSTQTNEAARCGTLLPQLSRIEGPVALLETGTSAGLCLHPDRYSYRFSSPRGEHRLDPADGAAEVVIDCRIDDAAAVPSRMPDVVWRGGIDLSPIDPADTDAVDWLANLIWPGPAHDERAQRLRAAARVAASDPARVVTGDIRTQVAALAAQAPADATLVVFHSAVLLYLDEAGCREFAAAIDEVRRSRTVVWISNEAPGTLPAYDPPLPPTLDASGRFVQTVDSRPVALVGQHGGSYETAPLR